MTFPIKQSIIFSRLKQLNSWKTHVILKLSKSILCVSVDWGKILGSESQKHVFHSHECL